MNSALNSNVHRTHIPNTSLRTSGQQTDKNTTSRRLVCARSSAFTPNIARVAALKWTYYFKCVADLFPFSGHSAQLEARCAQHKHLCLYGPLIPQLQRPIIFAPRFEFFSSKCLVSCCQIVLNINRAWKIVSGRPVKYSLHYSLYDESPNGEELVIPPALQSSSKHVRSQFKPSNSWIEVRTGWQKQRAARIKN